MCFVGRGAGWKSTGCFSGLRVTERDGRPFLRPVLFGSALLYRKSWFNVAKNFIAQCESVMSGWQPSHPQPKKSLGLDAPVFFVKRFDSRLFGEGCMK